MKKKKYSRKKAAEQGAARSYAEAKKYNRTSLTKEEYIKQYMRRKEYEDYTKYRRSQKGGVLHQEISEKEFNKYYEQLEDIGEEKFGFGKRLAKEDVIASKSRVHRTLREYGIDVKNMDNMQMHDFITNAISNGLFAKEQVEEIFY